MNTNEKLDLLASHHISVLTIETEKQKIIDSILTDEIKQKLADIDVEFAGKLDMMSRSIIDLEAEIKQDVLAQGATVKGHSLMAVWNKGRISWDTKGLDGFAVAHPEMAAFRSEGSPSVTLRKVGKGE